MITENDRKLKAAQGFTIGFEFKGSKFWINPDTWSEDKDRKLYEKTGFHGGMSNKGFVVFDPEFYEIPYNGRLTIIRSDIKRIPQPLGLTDYSNLFSFMRPGYILDLRHWDVSRVTSFKEMFRSDRELLGIDISGWDMSNATSIDYMFSDCSKLRNISMINCKLPNGTIEGLFNDCRELSIIRINENSRNIGIESVTNFEGCFALFSRFNINGSKMDNIDAGILYDAIIEDNEMRNKKQNSTGKMNAWI